jgi:hypothetical protein
MTNQQHPIIPPQDLRNKWLDEAPSTSVYDYLIDSAAQWGADTELEACCEWLDQKVLLQHQSDVVPALRAARRPKPLSLKEQALAALRHAPGPDYPNAITLLTADEHALIRRALEQLND